MSLRALRARAWTATASLAAAAALLAACTIHASRMRATAQRTDRGVRALARVLPAADVAFTGGARWLRAPTLEEPGAAQQDGIAFPDPEPGSGAMSPPRAAWAEEVRAR